jgi:hypothetical protein
MCVNKYFKKIKIQLLFLNIKEKNLRYKKYHKGNYKKKIKEKGLCF